MARLQQAAPKQGDALIVVDVQNDFLAEGSLAVPNGNEVIPVLNRYIKVFHSKGLPIYATRDWHTPDHCSFKNQGGIWPPHCVADTEGAQFSSELQLPEDTTVVSKADSREQDVYSGFEGTLMDQKIRQRGVLRVYIGGLATDYCVLNTVKDAINMGYQVVLLSDAIRAVNIKPDDGARAEQEMKALGALSVVLNEIAEH